VTAWLRRGAAAASLAGERGDLWPPATLASLVYLGWLPLLAVVAPPNGNDLEYFGVSLITSGAYPWNVVALCVAAVAGFVLLLLAAAVAEIALAGLLRRRPTRAASRTALSGLAVLLLATLPVIVAAAALVSGIVAVAPGVYISPDVQTPVLLRLAGALLPHLAGVALHREAHGPLGRGERLLEQAHQGPHDVVERDHLTRRPRQRLVDDRDRADPPLRLGQCATRFGCAQAAALQAQQ